MKKMLIDTKNRVYSIYLLALITVNLLSCSTNNRINRPEEKIVSIDTLFYPNGKINEIYATIDSVKQGLCIGYDTLGRKIYESTYVDGKWYGPFITYSSWSGKVMVRTFCKNNTWDGPHITYHESGNIETSSTFKNGKLHGLMFRYKENGQLQQKLLFDNDTVKTVLFDDGSYPPAPPREK